MGNKRTNNTTANDENANNRAINLSDVQAQIDAMLEKAKEEADRIVAEAKAATGAEASEARKKFLEESKARGEELVEVKLFKDNNKYKDDKFVQVNGENIVIKRGVKVKIKRKFAEVLDNSDMQDYETSLLIEKKTNAAANMEL